MNFFHPKSFKDFASKSESDTWNFKSDGKISLQNASSSPFQVVPICHTFKLNKK